MLIVRSLSTEPAFNLAAEEYLFRNFSDDVFFLYINSPAVVVGKHQNAMAEINPWFVNENKVQVIRRLSGGGAVYHDLGNLNFSFHQTVADTAMVSFKKFNQPIVEVLAQMGIDAEIGKRNDIFVDGYKVSGHAEHVFRNRVMSHGTLLFNADRKSLSLAIKNPSFENFKGKAIQSVRSKVANIVDFLQVPVSIDQFISKIESHMFGTVINSKKYSFTENDVREIENLSAEKYSTWNWNFGYSPNYRFEKSTSTKFGKVDVVLSVEKGIIVDCSILLNGVQTYETITIQQLLLQCPYNIEQISVKYLKLEDKIFELEVFLSCIF
ncbi:MAG TPA: lipoate--protein ligase [Prolixibacteraceae bacterium]|nr:lipoate--protein ligase [Prolixibacteraceae bacterium]